MSSILISIKPQYSQQILSGAKQVEYRKRVGVDHSKWSRMLIYESSPTMRVVGYAAIHSVMSDTPKNVYEGTRSYSGIAEDKYYEYFKDSATAYGILLDYAVTFKNKVSLSNLGIARAPQSWQNIDEELFNKAVELGNSVK